MRSEIEFYAAILAVFVLPTIFIAWIALDEVFGLRPFVHRLPYILTKLTLFVVVALIVGDVLRQSLWGAS